MSMIELGITGRRELDTTNPRDLLKRIVDSNSGAEERALLVMFKTEVMDDDDCMASIIEAWFRSNYHSLIDKPDRRKNPERKQQIEQIKQVVKARATRMVLMEMIMPNGKPLADCTGADCASAGGWLCRVAMKIAPNEKVGKALTETELQRLRG